MASSYKRQDNLETKQKNFRTISIIEAIVAGIFVAYIGLMVDAVMYHEHADITEAFPIAFSYLTNFDDWRPFYFLPIDYNISMTITFVTIVELLLFVTYTFNKNRIHHDINTLKGSSVWAKLKDITDKYADHIDEKKKKNFRDAFNNSICSENVYVSMNTRKHFHALNMLILGATGSGKSRYYLKPNILQMNTSYVVTDPKGEILDATGEMLKRNGYNVKIFDIVEMGKCNTYNPLKYCRQESDIKKIAQAFIKNTDPTGGKGGGNKDPFWDDSMNAFMCACIAFLCTKPSGYDRPYAQIPEVTGGNAFTPCFATLCELTRMANKKWTPNSGINLFGGAGLGDGKNNTANASELAAMFENLRNWELQKQQRENEDITADNMDKPYCLREWENFRIAPEKTSTTILMTTAVRLDPFNIEQVKNLTSVEFENPTEIDLDSFGKGRDALFVIIPPTDKTYNFLVAFLYTQLFDTLYYLGSKLVPGSKNMRLRNGELVKFFSKEEVEDEDNFKKKIESMRNATKQYVNVGGSKKGHFNKQSVTIDDGWYDILDADGELITRRQTKELADKYIEDLKHAKVESGRAPAIPCHVRFLMDEFPNIGEVPEFKEKLATMRGYEISCTVICQSITQLKGMYPDDYEVIDGNCPFVIFLGGDENSNNEYLSKKIGSATVKGSNASVDSKKINSSYNVEERQLLKQEEFGRIDYSKEIVFIYGEQPIMDDKFDYPAHRNYKYCRDYAADCGTDAFIFQRGHLENIEKTPLRFAVESATATIEVKEFTAEAFLKCFAVTSIESGLERMSSAMERYSLESESTATAF